MDQTLPKTWTRINPIACESGGCRAAEWCGTAGRSIQAAMKRLEGRTAVVTGAAGGIGRAVAERLARAGCHLALCDRNESALAATAEAVEGMGRRASRHVVDVSKRA